MSSLAHWQQEIKEFAGEFLRSRGLDSNCVMDAVPKRLEKSSDMTLSFCKHAKHQSPVLDETLNEICELLPKVSRDWRYQINSAFQDSGKIFMTVSRPGLSIGAIQTVINMERDDKQLPVWLYLDVTSSRADSTLTEERLALVRDVTARLLTLTGHAVAEADPGPGAALVCVTVNSRLRLPDAAGAASGVSGPQEDGGQSQEATGGQALEDGDGERTVSAARLVVEPVVNLETGRKELDVTPAELRRRRQAALLSASECRDRGGRPEQLLAMARAAVTHEMLSVSVSSRCRLCLQPDALPPAAERAVFALYNYARLQTLLDRFDAEVSAGVYPPLPSIAEIGHEFHRLSTEDEWRLVRHHLLPFPALLEDCARDVLAGRPALHRLCAGLAALSQTFSRYYSRTHVLTPPAEHLLPTLYVRVHLLRAVHAVFRHYFHLLGYEPLGRM